MTLQRNSNFAPINIPSSTGAIVTHNGTGRLLVKSILLHNLNSSSETVSIYFVPNSGGSLGTASESIGSANRVARVTVPSADTVEVLSSEMPIVMTANNDSIQAKTTTNNAVVAVIVRDVDV